MRTEPLLTDDAPETVPSPTATEQIIDREQERSIRIGERLRSRQTIISFLVAFAIIYFVFRQLNIDFSEVRRQVGDANPLYLALAFASYYGSFPIRAARWRALLTNARISREHGFNMPGIRGMSEIYLLSWFVNCVVPAKLGDAYRGYLLKKNAGPSFSRTLGTIFAERLLDVVALVALMVLSGMLVFQGTVPPSLRWWFLAGAALVAIAVIGMATLMTVSHRIEKVLPARFQDYFGRLVDGILTSFSRRRFLSVSAFTIMIWMLEGSRVYFAAHALGVDLSIAGSVFVALLASLLTTFPFTPAGLGVVEGGTVLALKLFGVNVASATAVALIDRGIASYSVVLIGGLLYLVSKHK